MFSILFLREVILALSSFVVFFSHPTGLIAKTCFSFAVHSLKCSLVFYCYRCYSNNKRFYHDNFSFEEATVCRKLKIFINYHVNRNKNKPLQERTQK